MDTEEAPHYYVWGIDHVAYGPVELPPLVSWVRDERVYPDTWIYDQRAGKWLRGSDITELQGLFKRGAAKSPQAAAEERGIKPGSLRRIKVLACFSDDQLSSFARYLEVVKVPQYKQVVRAGDDGDTMFMVLEGQLRVRVMVNGRESILATLEPGESFGELALMDEGKRSADVIANVESVVLTISAGGLEKLFQEAPTLAAPFLRALARATAARLRVSNRRVEDSIRLSQAAN